MTQAAVVGAQQVVAFVSGNKFGQRALSFREEVLDAIQEPVDFAGPAQKNSSQHKAQAMLGVGFAVGQCERRSPRPTKYQPSFDSELGAQLLHIGDQMGRGVVGQFAMRR